MPTKQTMTEAHLQREVIKLARDCGWRVAHFHDSRREVVRKDGTRRVIGDADAKGFPDLVMVRDGRLLFVELKGATGRLRPEQHAWIDALNVVAQESAWLVAVECWRPADWHNDYIRRVLR